MTMLLSRISAAIQTRHSWWSIVSMEALMIGRRFPMDSISCNNHLPIWHQKFHMISFARFVGLHDRICVGFFYGVSNWTWWSYCEKSLGKGIMWKQWQWFFEQGRRMVVVQLLEFFWPLRAQPAAVGAKMIRTRPFTISHLSRHQPDNFVILASFSDNKQGTISVSEIVIIWNRPCVQVNVGLVHRKQESLLASCLPNHECQHWWFHWALSSIKIPSPWLLTCPKSLPIVQWTSPLRRSKSLLEELVHLYLLFPLQLGIWRRRQNLLNNINRCRHLLQLPIAMKYKWLIRTSFSDEAV